MSALELAMLLGTDENWRYRASCRDVDPEIFTLATQSNLRQLAANEQARRLCHTCPVAPECRDFGKRSGAEGVIYGGWARKPRMRERKTAAQPLIGTPEARRLRHVARLRAAQEAA